MFHVTRFVVHSFHVTFVSLDSLLIVYMAFKNGMYWGSAKGRRRLSNANRILDLTLRSGKGKPYECFAPSDQCLIAPHTLIEVPATQNTDL